MKKVLAVVAAFAALIGIIPAASGQGTVSFTPVNGTTFSNYLNQASWIAVADTRGDAGFISPTDTTSAIDLNSAFQTSVLITNGNGFAGLTVQIVNGQFGSTGATVSSSVGSQMPITDLLIGIVSSAQPQYPDMTAAVSDLYIGNNYEASVANTANSPFSGMLLSFQDPSAKFNMSCTINTGLGAGSQIYFVAIADPVPERPNQSFLKGVYRRVCDAGHSVEVRQFLDTLQQSHAFNVSFSVSGKDSVSLRRVHIHSVAKEM